MTRVRIIAIGMLVAFALASLAYPALLISSHAFGYSAGARVTECHYRPSSGSRTSSGTTRCDGTWTAPGGEPRRGHISGVDDDDVSREVPVRVGLLGARAGNPAATPGFVIGVGWFTVVYGGTGLLLWRGRARRKAAEARFLAVPGGTFLRARPARVTTLDGGPHLTLRRSEGPRPARGGPAPLPRTDRPTPFRSPAGIGTGRGEFGTAHGPDERPRFHLSLFDDEDHEPELHVLDLAGTTRAVVQRSARHPARFRFVSADGEPLGEARANRLHSRITVTDTEGREVVTLRAGTRSWLVRLDPNVPSRLDEAIGAFALHIGRLLL
ncbi:hypothetical protein [Actinomadura sp. 9N407]|uniref:hypothetical protein n=1 Tax=Actinomadura sp. 9N407 TaxID=3375154 RepID=UPI0037B8D2B7